MEKKSVFFPSLFLHLHLVSAPSWEMEFINQGQITLCLAFQKKKEMEMRELESQAEVLGGIWTRW